MSDDGEFATYGGRIRLTVEVEVEFDDEPDQSTQSVLAALQTIGDDFLYDIQPYTPNSTDIVTTDIMDVEPLTAEGGTDNAELP